ncbi:hypothetical protein POUND7_003704 [Theobroma cacao]
MCEETWQPTVRWCMSEGNVAREGSFWLLQLRRVSSCSSQSGKFSHWISSSTVSFLFKTTDKSSGDFASFWSVLSGRRRQRRMKWDKAENTRPEMMPKLRFRKEGKYSSSIGLKSTSRKLTELTMRSGCTLSCAQSPVRDLLKRSKTPSLARTVPRRNQIKVKVGRAKNEYEGGKGRQEYDTSTRGHRRNFPARAVGEGVYRILRHNSGKKKMHTHLIYEIEFPPEDEENEPQESLNIKREGSFVIQIKNPEQPGKSQFRGLQKKRKAAFPAHLQGQLGQNRYHPADPPDFLNYEGCEFLLISTRSWVWNLRPKGKQIHLVQIWSGLSGRLHLQLPFSRAFGLE